MVPELSSGEEVGEGVPSKRSMWEKMLRDESRALVLQCGRIRERKMGGSRIWLER